MPRGFLEAEIDKKEEQITEKIIVARRCSCGAYSALALDYASYEEWRSGKTPTYIVFPEFNEKERDILDHAICSVCWDLDRLVSTA